jgi:hypothetical protein
VLLSCKLPVASGDAPLDGNPGHGTPGHGGFVQFPSGTFTSDPASLGTYDRAQSKWLPVPRAWVAPDGSRYAYSVNPVGTSGPVTGTIHVVDVASGADHPIVVPSTSNVLSYESEGIYVVHVVPSSGAPSAGLGLLDPASGSFKQITASGTWSAIGGGFAWGADLDSSIAPPPGEMNAANRLMKVELKTGTASVVAKYPGASVRILGVDSGQPVVSLGPVPNGPAYSVNRLDGMKMYAADAAGTIPTAPIVNDDGAIWFSSLSGNVWRWDDPHMGIHSVVTTPLQSVVVAGTCR